MILFQEGGNLNNLATAWNATELKKTRVAVTYFSRQTSFYPQLQRDSLFWSRRYKTAPLLLGNACQMYRVFAHFLVHLFLGRIYLKIECRHCEKICPEVSQKTLSITYVHTQVFHVSTDFRRTRRWSIFVLGQRSRVYMSWWLIHRFDNQFVLRLQDNALRERQRLAYMVVRNNLRTKKLHSTEGHYTFS